MNNEYREKAEAAVDAILAKEGVVALDRMREMMIKAYAIGNAEGQFEQHRIVREMHRVSRLRDHHPQDVQVVYPLRRKFGLERNEG